MRKIIGGRFVGLEIMYGGVVINLLKSWMDYASSPPPSSHLDGRDTRLSVRRSTGMPRSSLDSELSQEVGAFLAG